MDVNELARVSSTQLPKQNVLLPSSILETLGPLATIYNHLAEFGDTVDDPEEMIDAVLKSWKAICIKSLGAIYRYDRNVYEYLFSETEEEDDEEEQVNVFDKRE